MTGVPAYMRAPWRGRFAAAALLALLMCAAPSTAAAQTVSAPTVKAAYLLNFVRFAEWPAAALAPGAPIAFCVVNDRVVASALEDLVKGRLVEGHTLAVVTPAADAVATTLCHLVFATDLTAKGTAALIASFAGKPILTVSDLDRFAQRGGVAQFFVESGTIRFAINLEASQRAGLSLSHKLLSLAKIVKDDRDAGR